jgi:hypothetical protein
MNHRLINTIFKLPAFDAKHLYITYPDIISGPGADSYLGKKGFLRFLNRKKGVLLSSSFKEKKTTPKHIKIKT